MGKTVDERHCVVCGYGGGNFVIRMVLRDGKIDKWFYHAPETSQACFRVYEQDMDAAEGSLW